jgi:uncharacterized membrane protein YsdA (DUF1294 family)
MEKMSKYFLFIGATFYLLLFALPLFICPMSWARRVGWKIPEDTDLANYLGRSLGGLILPTIIMSYWSARNPWKYRFMFPLILLIGIFQVIVHAYGFIKKKQPVTENLEIILYSVLSVLALAFYPKNPTMQMK